MLIRLKKSFQSEDSYLLENIIRTPYKFVPPKIISTFQKNKRPQDRPNTTVRYYFINDIEKSFIMMIQLVLSIVGLILSFVK